MYVEFEKINKIFQIICWTATLAMGCWCMYNYWIGENLSLVGHKRFGETDEDVKPAISICLPRPFLHHKFDKFYPGMNVTDYQNFLLGQHWDANMLLVDFEKVTISLNDYILQYLVVQRF